MRIMTTVITGIFGLSALAWITDSSNDFERYWPQWRGPYATGVSRTGDPPVEWSEDKNIKWKVEIPGSGHASPIVWGDRVFVQTAIETGAPVEAQQQSSRGRHPRGVQPTQALKYTILAINRKDGSAIWQRTAREELPHEGRHPTGTFASNSPVTDGQNVYAYFGSRGLYCYDMDGNLIWEKDLGDMNKRLAFGEGSSPTLYGDRIIINWDHEGQSFITALDKKTGKEIWKVERDEITSWATPIVVEHDGKAQVITNATNRIRSYDIATGKLIWECGGATLNTIPSPVSADGIVYVTSGFRGSSMQAIRLADAKGDISGTDAIVWQYNRDTPYTPSPLLYDDTIYILKLNSGILTCFNAKTGEAYYSRQRLEDVKNVYASPVGASDRVYFAGRDGGTLVIKRGPKFEVLASNTLDDGFDASPAIVDNEIYLRGRKYLYCVGGE